MNYSTKREAPQYAESHGFSDAFLEWLAEPHERESWKPQNGRRLLTELQLAELTRLGCQAGRYLTYDEAEELLAVYRSGRGARRR